MSDSLQYGALGLLAIVLAGMGWGIKYYLTDILKPRSEADTVRQDGLAAEQKTLMQTLGEFVKSVEPLFEKIFSEIGQNNRRQEAMRQEIQQMAEGQQELHEAVQEVITNPGS